MLTTRIRPKISVKPLATTKKSAASVTPLSVTTRNCFGSSIILMKRKTATTIPIATSTMRLASHAERPGAGPVSASGMVLPGPPAAVRSGSGGVSSTPSCAVRAMP